MLALHREHALSDMFTAYLLSRNIRYEEDLVDQLFNSSEKRLARVLLLLAHFGKEGTPKSSSPSQSGNSGRNGGDHAFESKLFHEQIPRIGLHRLPSWKWITSAYVSPHRRSPRLVSAVKFTTRHYTMARPVSIDVGSHWTSSHRTTD